MPPRSKSLSQREEKDEGEDEKQGRMKMVEGEKEGGKEGGKTYSFKVSGTVFEIEKRYEMIRPIGSGAYGVVM